MFTILEKIQKAGYKSSGKESQFSLRGTIRLGQERTNDHRIKRIREINKAILQLEQTLSSNVIKSFLGAIQYVAKFILKQWEKINRIQQLLVKKWIGIVQKERKKISMK